MNRQFQTISFISLALMLNAISFFAISFFTGIIALLTLSFGSFFSLLGRLSLSFYKENTLKDAQNENYLTGQ